jgi:hypothetical protein
VDTKTSRGCETVRNVFLLGVQSFHLWLTFVVKPVRDLVANHNADSAIVERLGEVLAVEEGLKDSRREHCEIS